MKNSFVFLVFLFTLSFQAEAQVVDTLRKINNKAFTHGEYIKFKVSYGWVNAGYATLKIDEKPYIMNGRETYRVVGLGESIGAFDWFFRVRDRYETYLDKQMITPAVFVRRVDEGGYLISQDYVFYQKDLKVYNGKSFLNVPAYVQDMISAFYYARTIDFTDAPIGQITTLQCFLDDSVYSARLKFVGRETIKTDLGKFRCLVFRPAIQTGRIFKHEEDLNVWITDDENKIPIRAEAKIMVGSIRMDLVEYKDLLNPISIEKKK